jgi:hypothetical protein
MDQPGIIRINNTPEACAKNMVVLDSPDGPVFPYPEKAGEILSAIGELYRGEYKIAAPAFVAVETWRNVAGRKVIAFLNYDNANPADVIVQLPTGACDIQIHSPERFGTASSEIKLNQIKLSRLDTMTIISLKSNR